jgi:hypothetical protein
MAVGGKDMLLAIVCITAALWIAGGVGGWLAQPSFLGGTIAFSVGVASALAVGAVRGRWIKKAFSLVAALCLLGGGAVLCWIFFPWSAGGVFLLVWGALYFLSPPLPGRPANRPGVGGKG